ncbi:MAG TPA: hypothetical protein DCX53_15765 [Anaerolineae bacterium]|nr:hypothetical protein [Anaerolineae bacterium]
MITSNATVTGIKQKTILRERIVTVRKPISGFAWLFLVFSTLLTFASFMIFDPQPSLLLAGSIAANVAIMFWALYRLYQMNLLLSPMSTAVIGPTMIVYYTIGNLGARIAGEGRFGSNLGSLEYFPLAAFLTTCGLLLFCFSVFFLFRNRLSYLRIRYQDMSWSPAQAVGAAMLAIGIVLYLSSKYSFVNGYFFGVETAVDRWLFASYLYFIVLAGLIGVSTMVKSKGSLVRLIGVLVLVALLILAVSIRSRTYLLGFISILGLAWVTLEPAKLKRILLTGAIIVLIAFPFGTIIKTVSNRGETVSISDNLQVLLNVDFSSLLDFNQVSAGVDVQYRGAGLEHPAALLMAYDRNASPMQGEALYAGVLSALPGFLRPSFTYSERQVIYLHFLRYGMRYGDSIGLPLSSGLADWGILLSPFVYLVIGALCVLLWKIGQLSPQLYLACVVIWMRVEPMDLFWEDGLLSLRAIAFVWLIITVFSFAFNPTMQTSKDDDQDNSEIALRMSSTN